MSKQTLQGLPQELINVILEHICKLIVQELTAFPSYPERYPSTLKQFLQLLLVSRRFHRILTLHVRVDGMPVRERLLDLQMQRLKNFMEFRDSSECEWQIQKIRATCGNVWGNPGVASLILSLFDYKARIQSAEGGFFHMCLLPKLFEKDNLMTVDKEEISPLTPTGPRDPRSLDERDDNSDDDRNKKEERQEFGDLVHNKRYTMDTMKGGVKRIEFVVGRYRFPTRLPDTVGMVSVQE